MIQFTMAYMHSFHQQAESRRSIFCWRQMRLWHVWVSIQHLVGDMFGSIPAPNVSLVGAEEAGISISERSQRLSYRQLPVQAVTEMSSKWHIFVNICWRKCVNLMTLGLMLSSLQTPHILVVPGPCLNIKTTFTLSLSLSLYIYICIYIY